MKFELKIRHLFQFIVLWSIIGYPLLAVLTAAFGGNNNLLSIIFRGMVVAASATLLMRRFRLHRSWFFWLFSIFWSAYILRLLIALHILNEPVNWSPEVYWIWSVGTCLLPSIAVFFGFDPRSTQGLLRPLFFISVLAMIVALFAGSTDSIGINGEVLVGSRLSLESLNAISMGHLGVTVALLSVSVLGIQSRPPAKAIALMALGTGVIFTVLANSRGPLVGLLVSLTFFFLTRHSRRSTVWLGVFMVTIVGYIVFTNVDIVFGANGLISRFTAISDGIDLSAQIRLTSFSGAFEQFIGSPIFGDGIEERITKYYPHNVILEAFMATGLVGGIPFFLLIVAAIRASWQLLCSGTRDIWIGLLTVQYVVGAQFSGAIYQSTAMWVLIGLVMAATQTEHSTTNFIYGCKRQTSNPNLKLTT